MVIPKARPAPIVSENVRRRSHDMITLCNYKTQRKLELELEEDRAEPPASGLSGPSLMHDA